MIVTPLVITPISNYVYDWHHPNIAELAPTQLTKVINKDKSVEYSGNIIRLQLSFDDERAVDIIVMSDSKGISEIVSEHGITAYVKQLTEMLTQPSWKINKTSFHKTEFGVLFNKLYPMNSENFELDVIENISILTNGDDWWIWYGKED